VRAAAACCLVIAVTTGVASVPALTLFVTFMAPLFLPGVVGMLVGAWAARWVPFAAVTMGWSLGWATYVGWYHVTHDVSDHPTLAGDVAARVAVTLGPVGLALCAVAIGRYVAAGRGRERA
jgi:hypothetical protein